MTLTDWPVLLVGFPLLIVGAPFGAWLGSLLHRRAVARGLITEED